MSKIVYFSRKYENFVNGKITTLSIGNTKVLAEKIENNIHAELIEIIPIEEYPKKYEQLVQMAEKEKHQQLRPLFKKLEVNIDEDDTIFLGFPNWCGTFPMVVAHFLESHDLSNKTIYPFCTHEGSAFGSSMIELKKLSPNSTIMQGLPVRGSRVHKADKAIENWLIHYQQDGGM